MSAEIILSIFHTDSFLEFMYKIEINRENDKWLAALCQDKKNADAFFETLADKTQEFATCSEVSRNTFPVIVIENCSYENQAKPYFEYVGFEELQARLNTLRTQKVDDEEHIYFKYYYIAEDFFQSLPDENYMRFMQHTSVTNLVLDETVSAFQEEVKKRASQYDIEGLDELFEQTKTLYTSEKEKKYLAEYGYDSLFWDMNYDHACSKLTDEGIYSLVPMIEKMEILLEEKKWQHRSFANHILLEKACENEPENAISILKDTTEAFAQYLISHPEEKLEIHRLLAQAYRMVLKIDPENALLYWQYALSEMQEAIAFSPEKASWSSLLELLYTPFFGNKNILEAQAQAKLDFEEKIVELEARLGVAISYPLALAYQELEEYLEWRKIENVFPEKEFLRWAEKSLTYDLQKTTRLDLHQCAEFFHRFGINYNRIDFLEKTIQLYERVLKATSDCAFEVYYVAKIWKEINEIHLANQQNELAEKAISNAIAMYKNHYEMIKTNPSVHLHYAEFLEYCYHYKGNIEKPSLSELKTIAEEIELESKGFLSYPYVLLARIALFEKNEAQAICELTKSLILHELCGDSTFQDLKKELEHTDFEAVKTFLIETESFMEAISDGYYYNPEMEWETLITKTPDEIIAYWEKRKLELKNRPKDTLA